MKKITTPLTDDIIKDLKVGDMVSITGMIYTARDAAHKKLIDLVENGEDLPFDPNGAVIYYVGPTPAKPGQVIGSAGPTTSYRMDVYSNKLMDYGVKGMIGKGERSIETRDKIVKTKSVYFTAIGGTAALIASSIKEAKVIAFPELLSEAVRELYVEGFTVIVANDIYGNNIYDDYKKYQKE